jgi:hypothetical protein
MYGYSERVYAKQVEASYLMMRAWFDVDGVDFSESETLEPHFYKFFDKMTIINVRKFNEAITRYKMKMADEFPDSWTIINKLFNDLKKEVLPQR